MLRSLPMVLVADRDCFSNTSLSNALRKLGLARNVVCTKSADSAMTYLQKQQICQYPFPDIVIYNDHDLRVTSREFAEQFKSHFSEDYDSKIILLLEKDAVLPMNLLTEEDIVIGGLRKPVSFNQLRKLFRMKNRKLAYS